MSRKTVTALAVCVLLTASLAAGAQQPTYFQLTLITTNDLHANLLPVNQPATLEGKIPQTKNVGGAARRATYVNRVKASSKNPVLLLDSGDTTYGYTVTGRPFHGAADVAVMNAMGYLAMEPGNHDFQWPSPDTLRNIKDSKFPWVCANLIDQKTGKLLLQPYVIRECGGVRIALFGLITSLVDDTPYKAARELGLHTTDPIQAAKTLIPELRQKADIVICLSHLGGGLDVKLAQAVPGIDVILGGHSHSRYVTPRMVQVGTPTATYMGAVPVVQSFQWGSEIGDTRVIFYRDASTGKYTLMSCKGTLVSLDSSIPDDPAIAGLIQSYVSRAPKPAPKPAPAPAPAAAQPAVAK